MSPLSKVFIICVLALMPNLVLAGQNGRGGAGVHRDGQYLTFASAGIRPVVSVKIDPVELRGQDLPGLDLLIHTLEDLPISSDYIAKLEGKLVPSSGRRYFKIDENTLSANQKQAIIDTYKNLTNVSAQDLVIYAITDPDTKETYLLPEFFLLKKESEKAAILYHELLWSFPEGVKAGYSFVINAEINMQNLIDQPSDAATLQAVSDIETLFGQTLWALGLAFKSDMKSGVLNDLLVPTKFGPGLSVSPFYGKLDEINFDSTDYFAIQLYQLIKTHPQSLFLKTLQRYNFEFRTHFSGISHNLSPSETHCYALSPGAFPINSGQIIRLTLTCNKDPVDDYYRGYMYIWRSEDGSPSTDY